ncbi:hypothetical protein VPH35_093332 [Triticum aestivum]|uniref:protein SPT2 homolog n=1 Tax=Triticum aestivum TaxID=4565 RepID=UPI001D002E4D|nr:protein SPT2 homolog [Triticum aestivum]
MAGNKRKADDNINGARHPAAQTEATAGDDLAGTSSQASGPTANPAGDGTAGTSQALAGPTAATTGSAGGSSQSGGAPPHRQAFAGQTATTPAFAVGYPGSSSQFGGAAGGGFSQPHSRAPTTPVLRPPLGNPAARRAGGGSGYRGFSQPPSQGMLWPPRGNPAVGSAPFPYHAPAGNGSLSGQSQIAGPTQTGTGQPLGHSGSGGPSSAISSASASGAPVNPLVRACPRCNRPTIVVLGLSPLCADCLSTFVISYVLPRHPEIHYGGARATQGQGISNGHQRQLDHRLRQPSSAAQPRARAAVGPLMRAPTDGWCSSCLALTRDVLGSSPLCQVCYNRRFVAGGVPPQHAQTGGHVLLNPVPRGPVPASEQQYRAAAIGPSSSSSSAVGSGPICQACGYPLGTGNRACRFGHLHGPPPPPPGLG